MASVAEIARLGTGVYVDRAQTGLRALRGDDVALLRTPVGQRDPYPIYERLRARGPLVPTAMGNWAVVGHEQCRLALRDRRFGMQSEQVVEGQLAPSLLELNPPEHTRLRRLVAPAFSPRRMPEWELRIERIVSNLLDGVGESFDLVTGFANPVPVEVICELLGTPRERAREFARYGDAFARGLDGPRSLLHLAQLFTAVGSLERIFTDLFADRRARPRDDLISAVVAAEGEQITPAEMISLCVLLLVAGFETTVNLIGNTVLALLAHPEQWRAVVDDPGLAGAAVEETLRWDPPVQHTSRIAFEDVTIGDAEVRRGQWLVVLIGAANRDPAAHDDPARFDIFRTQNENLAFSSGIHYCVGQPLARLEATIAVRELARRRPRLHRVGPVVQRRVTTLRGPKHVRVAG